MRFFLFLILAALLFGCTPSREENEVPQETPLFEKGAYIGYLESVTLNYRDWLAPDNVSGLGNGCGQAIGTYRIFTGNKPPTARIEIQQNMGEWCRNPFTFGQDISKVHLILLGNQNTANSKNPIYFGRVFPVYATEFEVFVDISLFLPLYDKSGELLYRGNLLSKYDLLKHINTLHEPVYIDYMSSGEPYQINHEYFEVQKNNLYVKKSIILDQKFPEISKFLINNNIVASPPFGPFILPEIDQIK